MNESPKSSIKRRIEGQRQVDRVCDDIELRWKRNESVDIAAIAKNFDPVVIRAFLSELIKVDFEVRKRSFDTILKDYVALFPERADVINDIVKEHRLGELTEVPTQKAAKDRPVEHRDLSGKKIGEYFVEKHIGSGGFGTVYLARDSYLPRYVVIKVPLVGKLGSPEEVENFLDEARNAALLNHPNILRVFHVGIDSGLPYIVQEFFEGGDLAKTLSDKPFTIPETVRFVEQISYAIGYAHKNRIVHRDIKPANILIGTNGEPIIADFGLSVRDSRSRVIEGEMVGTLRYMSPEQVRGEVHRLDGRTDIWSIGVLMYYMLTHQYPFVSSDVDEISQMIAHTSPFPARQLNATISEELNRICMKCLATRAADRYSTAYDLANDLKDLSTSDSLNRGLNQPVSSKESSPRPITPKGLAAFDGTDREFFFDLLPGTQDRHGVPECIRFWKTRIENPELSNPVSLLFGPSGCGKSSLVAAGLIPILNESVIVVTVESTTEDTEVRFLKALRAIIPEIPDKSLPDLVAAIRSGEYLPKSRRLLIVFDQFEQWLHANTNHDQAQLVDALRQCDGERVQTLILARDDFFMAITRFFKKLEIDLVEGRNFASVDLFSRKHAKVVLTKFGQAFDRLPQDNHLISESQDQFLDQAIDMIAEDDSVICVRSALFAETFKNREWNLDTIKSIGNATDIGVDFLEQKLGDAAKNPKYRFHQEQIIAVLEELLPPVGIQIKGNLKSKHDLAAAAGLSIDSKEFESILNILDSELRLITPTEPDLGRNHQPESLEYFYQLTHDYLVPSLRDWISSVHGRTIQGRTVKRMYELSQLWENSKESRFLPSLFEFGSMLLHVPKRMVRPIDKKLIRNATFYYGWRTTLAISIFVVASALFIQQNRSNSRNLVSRILTCPPDLVPMVANEMISFKTSYADAIRERINNELSDSERRRAVIAIALLDQAGDHEFEFLVNAIDKFNDSESKNLNNALAKNSELSIKLLQQAANSLSKRTDDSNRLHNRLTIMLAFLDPSYSLHQELEFRADPTDRSNFVHQFKTWHGNLSVFSELLAANRTDDELQGICLAVGSIPKRQFDQKTAEKIEEKLIEFYRHHPESEVHSAAGWVLSNWGSSLPKIDPTEPTDLAADTQWWINDLGMTMIRVRGGTMPKGIRDRNFIDRDFFISSTETTVYQFNLFLSDEKAEKRTNLKVIDQNELLPVTEIAIEDAYEFCNWLSEKSGLKRAYRKTGRKLNPKREDEITEDDLNVYESPYFRGHTKHIWEWELIENSNGFRIPTDLEWSMASRSGIVSIRDNYISSEGNFEGFVDYCWYASNSDGEPLEVRQKFPNYIGLYDMLGNAWEYVSSVDAEAALRCRGSCYSNQMLGIGDGPGYGINPYSNGAIYKDTSFRVVLPARQ